MAEPHSPYATLATLSGRLPSGQVLTELLRRLTANTGATRVRLWRSSPRGSTAELSWPPDTDRVQDAVRPELLEQRSEVDASALVQDAEVTLGALTLTTGGRRAADDDVRRQLAETADCVLLVWRRDELRAGLDQQVRHTHRLAGELADSGRRLATVRDLERRRVATEIITLSTGPLGELYRQVDQLSADLAVGVVPTGPAGGQLRNQLDELIEAFRLMVRGIHPQVLEARGPRAALAEVVAGLSRPARITGGVPARIDQELGAALYRLTVSALQTLARTETQDTLDIHLDHVDDQLGVLVTGGAQTSPAALRAALTVDIDRLAALGGGVEITVQDGVVTLRAWVPDRLEPESRAPRVARSTLSARVRSVALGLAAQYRDGPGYDRAQALVTRLDGPVRLGVQGFRGSIDSLVPALNTLARRLPELVLLTAQTGAGGRGEPGGHGGQAGGTELPDVVLHPSADDPEYRLDVALVGAGVLIRAAAWPDLPRLLATEVVSRADLLRARSVLAALAALLRAVPLTGSAARWFGYELEQLQAGAHELAELEALAQLRTGTIDLTRAQLRTAERLLGCNGVAPHERLGLPETATAADLDAAAAEQMDPWRRLADSAAAGRRQRQACSVVVQTCEGLLTRELTRG